MPTRKINDPREVCRDQDHHPPSHMYYERGVYEHTCPSCGKRTVFAVNPPSL